MALATFSVRMDENLKKQFDSMSLRKAAKDNRVQDWTLDEINNEINDARRDKEASK